VPRTTPTPTTSSPSPSPTSTEDQVEAAVRAYYAELIEAVRTGDPTELKPLVDRNCPCYRAVEVIEQNSAKGHKTPDAELSVVSVRVHDVEGKTSAAEVSFDASAYDVVDSAGTVVERIPARKSRVDLSLVENDTRWIVTNLFNLGGR
jgi:predicted lipid-binding transport protein (Tim44 family)